MQCIRKDYSVKPVGTKASDLLPSFFPNTPTQSNQEKCRSWPYHLSTTIHLAIGQVSVGIRSEMILELDSIEF